MLFQKEIQTLQFLPIKGIINARDLGGYVTADGRTVLASAYIRDPLGLTDADIEILRTRYLM